MACGRRDGITRLVSQSLESESLEAEHSAPFPPGTLWSRLVERERGARERGALQPFATETRVIEDHGVAFQVRAVTSLAGRPRARAADRAQPFLPPEPDLLVTGVTSTHVCVLNKYPVLAHHALIVTRQLEAQESVLRPGDFEALWRCLAEFDALGFYNGGPVAGASQPHKHLQLVPLPLAPDGFAIPTEAWLEDAARSSSLRRVPRIPFRHAFRWLPDAASADARAADSHRLYRAMLADVGLDPDAPGPYNLLVTRRYLLLVPRVHERYEAVAVNALGFAGSLFVPTRAALETIVRAGPVAVLRHVTGS